MIITSIMHPISAFNIHEAIVHFNSLHVRVKSFQCREDGSIKLSSMTLSVFVVGFKMRKEDRVLGKKERTVKKDETERRETFCLKSTAKSIALFEIDIEIINQCNLIKTRDTPICLPYPTFFLSLFLSFLHEFLESQEFWDLI